MVISDIIKGPKYIKISACKRKRRTLEFILVEVNCVWAIHNNYNNLDGLDGRSNFSLMCSSLQGKVMKWRFYKTLIVFFIFLEPLVFFNLRQRTALFRTSSHFII
jgi:hypothetical protein